MVFLRQDQQPPAILAGLVVFHHHLNRKWQSRSPPFCSFVLTQDRSILHCAAELARDKDPPIFVWNNNRGWSLVHSLRSFYFALTSMPTKNVKICTISRYTVSWEVVAIVLVVLLVWRNQKTSAMRDQESSHSKECLSQVLSTSGSWVCVNSIPDGLVASALAWTHTHTHAHTHTHPRTHAPMHLHAHTHAHTSSH